MSISSPQGTHTLLQDRRILGNTCGILPFGTGLHGAHVWTEGLEWDLRAYILTRVLTADGEATSLGGFMSTSNHLAPGNDAGKVRLTTDAPIYWTVELKRGV